VLAIDGVTNLQAAIESQFPSALTSLFKSGNASAFDSVMLGLMNAPANSTETTTQLRWLIAQGMWSFNTTSPYSWFTQLGGIVADAAVLANVTCPVFVAEGENDSSSPGQAAQMAADLGNLSTYNLFKTDLGAGEHCQLGAEAQLTQVSLDWLADVWEGVSLPGNITGGVY
jgi:pimeloyl-ACP methyl ester carboxylesterase